MTPAVADDNLLALFIRIKMQTERIHLALALTLEVRRNIDGPSFIGALPQPHAILISLSRLGLGERHLDTRLVGKGGADVRHTLFLEL